MKLVPSTVKHRLMAPHRWLAFIFAVTLFATLAMQSLPVSAKVAVVRAAPVGPAAELSDADRAEAPPDGLNEGEWKSIQAQIREAEYHFTPHEPNAGFRAPNSRHGWQTIFTSEGAVVKPATEAADDADPWQWRMQLRGYGYAGAMQTVTPVLPTVAKNRVEYAWDETISEWWINDPNGLEQGFTLNSRPAGACADRTCPLVFDLALETNLNPFLENDAIRFDDANGETVLHYDKLLVWDADGEYLPAEMELSGGTEGNIVQLRVDDPLCHNRVGQSGCLN